MSSFAPYSAIPYSALRFGTAPGTPEAQTDWPNPVRRRSGSVTLLTWTDSFKLPLQQVLPPRQTDWPVPRGPLYPISLRTWSQSLVHILPVPIPNIMPNDFPNPRGPAFPISLRTWALPLTPMAMTFVPPLPKNQGDWPLPQKERRRGPADWVRGSTWLLSQPPPTMPRARPRDWPVPRGPRRSVSLLTHINPVTHFEPGPPAVAEQRILKNATGRVRALKNQVIRTRILVRDPDSG